MQNTTETLPRGTKTGRKGIYGSKQGKAIEKMRLYILPLAFLASHFKFPNAFSILTCSCPGPVCPLPSFSTLSMIALKVVQLTQKCRCFTLAQQYCPRALTHLLRPTTPALASLPPFPFALTFWLSCVMQQPFMRRCRQTCLHGHRSQLLGLKLRCCLHLHWVLVSPLLRLGLHLCLHTPTGVALLWCCLPSHQYLQPCLRLLPTVTTEFDGLCVSFRKSDQICAPAGVHVHAGNERSLQNTCRGANAEQNDVQTPKPRNWTKPKNIMAQSRPRKV